MNRLLWVGCLILALSSYESTGRERLDFNRDWSFARFGLMPDGSKKNEPKELEKPSVNDSDWRKLNLPHDWAIEGPFRSDLPNRTGKLPYAGIGWYRKQFTLPAADQGKMIFLDIDGAMSHATVYVNGKLAGEWPYGYASFRIDMTPHVKFGAKNVVAIRLDNPDESSRWYPGGGIYRNTWLVKTGKTYFPWGGIFVTTPKVTSNKATVSIAYKTKGGSEGTMVEGKIYYLGKGGASKPELVGTILPVKAGANGNVKATFELNSPQLWDTKEPHLYSLVSTIKVKGSETDRKTTTFGIRTIEFNADKGFLLNEKVVKLLGVCEHHDLGPLGASFNTRAMERKMELLDEMGCNSIRTAHNMPAPELLHLADRMGFLIINEAFDCWAKGKTKNDYGTVFKQWHERDLRSFVQRDRNSPSVIMWSTGNEIREQGYKAGHKISRELTTIIKSEDPTRPVTAGCNNAKAGFNGFEKTIDVFGYNYKPHLYRKFKQKSPKIPLYGSETASCVSSRGEYVFPVNENKAKGSKPFHVSSYDLYAPGWASKPDVEFDGQDKNPSVAGEYVWTGFDYIGEPTPFNNDATNLLNFQDEASRKEAKKMLEEMGDSVPSRSSYFGILDLCGFKKDRFYIYQARWRPELPMVHILPHWNWPERVGKVTPVHVYTSGDEAELFLNGTSLGKKKKGQYEYRLRWNEVKYQPGELKVVAYKNGKKWATQVMQTTDKEVALNLTADRKEISADGYDLSYITVSVEDAKGRVVPRTRNQVTFDIQGPGEIVGVGNGDQTSHESFQAKKRKIFNGYCQVIIRSKRGESGTIKLTAQSTGLTSAKEAVLSK